MTFLLKVSRILKTNNVYHKIKKGKIYTRRSIVNIPEINEDIAYLVGVIAGDGNLSNTKRKRGGYHCIIRIHANSIEYLKYLSELFNKYFHIKGKILKDKRKNNTYYIKIENASIFWYFKLLGAKYNYTNKLPNFCSRNKLFFHYLAGLIDTDGSIGPSKKRVQLKLKNNKIIQEIFSKIEKANPNPPKINYTDKIPFYYIRFDNIFPLRWKTNKFLKHKLPI